MHAFSRSHAITTADLKKWAAKAQEELVNNTVCILQYMHYRSGAEET